MSVLSSAVDEYLALRRTLGFKLTGVGHDLQQFVRFAESEGAEWVTTDMALRWATQPAKASPAHWARRLGIVRQFAQILQCPGPPHRDSAAGLTALSLRASTALSLPGRRSHRTD